MKEGIGGWSVLWLYLIWNMSRWSEISKGSIPERSEGLGSWFVKRLSIKVAVVGVIRVGLVIFGLREWAKLMLRNSLVGGWVLWLMRSRL